MLQWGRRNSPAETGAVRDGGRRRRHRFNGAAGIHRRKPEAIDRAQAESVCFNGAAGIHRRKRPHEVWFDRNVRGSFNGAAGIHRRKLGCAGHDPAAGGIGFNGAAGIHRRKPTTTHPLSTGPPAPLQWGRRNSPAETQGPRQGLAWPHQASMGPPEFTGGNVSGVSSDVIQENRLQWGRRNSPAETRCHPAAAPIATSFNGAAGIHRRKPGSSRRTGSCATVGFNGAAGIHRRKPCASQHGAAMGKKLQWGRRNSPAETRTRHPLSRAGEPASMGPPEFTGGNTIRRLPRLIPHVASMGPPEFTGGNTPSSPGPAAAPGRFNGAAGIHRRKPKPVATPWRRCGTSFNGAAGIHRRKPQMYQIARNTGLLASMGPPEFTGGNPARG